MPANSRTRRLRAPRVSRVQHCRTVPTCTVWRALAALCVTLVMRWTQDGQAAPFVHTASTAWLVRSACHAALVSSRTTLRAETAHQAGVRTAARRAFLSGMRRSVRTVWSAKHVRWQVSRMKRTQPASIARQWVRLTSVGLCRAESANDASGARSRTRTTPHATTVATCLPDRTGHALSVTTARSPTLTILLAASALPGMWARVARAPDVMPATRRTRGDQRAKRVAPARQGRGGYASCVRLAQSRILHARRVTSVVQALRELAACVSNVPTGLSPTRSSRHVRHAVTARPALAARAPSVLLARRHRRRRPHVTIVPRHMQVLMAHALGVRRARPHRLTASAVRSARPARRGVMARARSVRMVNRPTPLWSRRRVCRVPQGSQGVVAPVPSVPLHKSPTLPARLATGAPLVATAPQVSRVRVVSPPATKGDTRRIWWTARHVQTAPSQTQTTPGVQIAQSAPRVRMACAIYA